MIAVESVVNVAEIVKTLDDGDFVDVVCVRMAFLRW